MPPSSRYRARSLRTRDSPSLRRCLRKSWRQQGCRSGSPTSCFCRCQMPPSSIRKADYSVAPTAAEPGSITSGRSVGRRSRPISADRWAAELEAAGEAAFADFGVTELVGLLGSDFARRVKPLELYRWGSEPFARGSYSYALPGQAECRGEAKYFDLEEGDYAYWRVYKKRKGSY